MAASLKSGSPPRVPTAQTLPVGRSSLDVVDRAYGLFVDGGEGRIAVVQVHRDGGLLMVIVEVDPADEDEFNRWYDDEHIPEKRAAEGFRSARRFVAPEGGRYLALYEIDDPAAVTSEAYMTQPVTDWTKAIMQKWRQWDRSVWYEITKPDPADRA
jgi:hypothetical protein